MKLCASSQSFTYSLQTDASHHQSGVYVASTTADSSVAAARACPRSGAIVAAVASVEAGEWKLENGVSLPVTNRPY